MPETRTMYIELRDPAGPEEVRAALENAGLQLNGLRGVTRNQDGYILTDLLARGIWEHETSLNQCLEKNPGRCPGIPVHRDWTQLSETQQEEFIKRYAGFLESCRQDQLMPEILLRDCDEFKGTALTVQHAA